MSNDSSGSLAADAGVQLLSEAGSDDVTDINQAVNDGIEESGNKLPVGPSSAALVDPIKVLLAGPDGTVIEGEGSFHVPNRSLYANVTALYSICKYLIPSSVFQWLIIRVCIVGEITDDPCELYELNRTCLNDGECEVDPVTSKPVCR